MPNNLNFPFVTIAIDHHGRKSNVCGMREFIVLENEWNLAKHLIFKCFKRGKTIQTPISDSTVQAH
jgi:hypothetical protein